MNRENWITIKRENTKQNRCNYLSQSLNILCRQNRWVHKIKILAYVNKCIVDPTLDCFCWVYEWNTESHTNKCTLHWSIGYCLQINIVKLWYICRRVICKELVWKFSLEYKTFKLIKNDLLPTKQMKYYFKFWFEVHALASLFIVFIANSGLTIIHLSSSVSEFIPKYTYMYISWKSYFRDLSRLQVLRTVVNAFRRDNRTKQRKLAWHLLVQILWFIDSIQYLMHTYNSMVGVLKMTYREPYASTSDITWFSWSAITVVILPP